MQLKEFIKDNNPIAKIVRYFKRKKLVNENFTLLTMNCFAGIVYHNLNIPFLSPTINIRFENIRHFYKFCSNLKYYISTELVEIPSNEPYPMAKLDDLIIHLVHYKTFIDAKKKWDERKIRINYDNLYIIANDYVTETERLSKEEILAFGTIPCKNLVVQVQEKYIDIPYAYYMGKKYLS